MKTIERSLIALMMVLLIFAGTSSAHRMLMGYKVNELELNAMYDDGTPAQGVGIEVYKEGELYAQGVTDSAGSFVFEPKKGDRIEDLSFVSYSTGHRAELSLNLGQEKSEDSEDMPLPMKVVAGFGYLLGLAGLSMIYVSKKKT